MGKKTPTTDDTIPVNNYVFEPDSQKLYRQLSGALRKCIKTYCHLHMHEKGKKSLKKGDFEKVIIEKAYTPMIQYLGLEIQAVTKKVLETLGLTEDDIKNQNGGSK